MKKIHSLSLLAVLVSTAAYPMQFAAQMNKVKLPLILSTELPPSIKYTPPGTIAVSALRMCGDGDVVNFAGEHPEFDFVPHTNTNIDVVMGYWAVEDGATEVIPSVTNWYPIAYQKVPVAESAASLAHVGKFLPISHADVAASANVMTQVRSDLINLHKLAQQSFKTDKSYRVFAGTFACVDPDDAGELTAEGSGTYTPTPIETIQSLHVLEAEVNDAFDSIADADKVKKINIDPVAAANRNVGKDTPPTPYKYELKKNQGTDLDPTLFATFNNIVSAIRPILIAPLNTVDDYKAAMAAAYPWGAALGSGISGDQLAYCNAQGATSHKDNKRSYEIFPMNLSCKHLFKSNDIVTSYNDLFNPTVIPSVGEFLAAQKTLAKRFLMAAAFETVQNSFNTEAKVVRSGCVVKKSGQDLIGRIVASYPLKFAVENPAATGTSPYTIRAAAHNHIHPESLFALSDYFNYAPNPALAVWGQVVPSQGTFNATDLKTQNGILLPLGNSAELNKHPVNTQSFGAPININFKIRSVGGSCTIFC